MLKPWTPASARGTSTAQRERDAPGKKMQALGVLGCTRRQEMPLALRGEERRTTGGSGQGDPAPRCSRPQ